MRYDKVYLAGLGYELAPVVVDTAEIEERLKPALAALRIAEGQIESLTGIKERRWWLEGTPLSQGAAAAARKALAVSGLKALDIETLVYAGVCRENFEPATACRVAHALGVSRSALVFDISNACLGMLNGILEVANRIELGQIRAGMVVSCESAREINDIMIDRLLAAPEMELFKTALASFTGGSGAAAVILADAELTPQRRRRLAGGVAQNAPEHHGLCTWGLDHSRPGEPREFMATDSVAVLQHGVTLGTRTWNEFLRTLAWQADTLDKVICHQVGSGHRDSILSTLGLPQEKDFSTFPFLGNIGTVSLPLTAAVAEERGFLKPGDKVGLLGIGSGLNCLMLGVEW